MKSSSYTAVDYNCSDKSACTHIDTTTPCLSGGGDTLASYTVPAGSYTVYAEAYGYHRTPYLQSSGYCSSTVTVSVGGTSTANMMFNV